MKKMFCYKTECKNGFNISMDIMTGEKLSSIWLANMELIYWSVHSSRRIGGNGVKWESLFQPATCFTLIEKMKIWCKIQETIYQLM